MPLLLIGEVVLFVWRSARVTLDLLLMTPEVFRRSIERWRGYAGCQYQWHQWRSAYGVSPDLHKAPFEPDNEGLASQFYPVR